ncbi:MAG: sigma-70 family RNA polymerase sigma factor [Myxococcaceae bacterium]
MLLEATQTLPATFEVPRSADAETVERCREGDARAWRRLYDQNFDFAYRTARRLGTPESECEDVVHEAFEIALRKLGDFDHGLFSTWLYRIVSNVVSARLRKKKVRDFFHGIWSSESEESGENVEDTVAARRTLERVEEVLRSMSAAKREVFALHELEGLTHERIGELLGIKAETVRTRLFYAKQDFEKLARKRGLL